MKTFLLLLPLAALATSGCMWITENRMFPKPAFIWSREAIEQRQEERNYQRLFGTNSPAQ